MPIDGVAAVVEELSGVLADGFEQSVAGSLAGEVDGDEGGAHELVEHVDRWRMRRRRRQMAVNAARSQPPANTLIARSAAWAEGESSL